MESGGDSQLRALEREPSPHDGNIREIGSADHLLISPRRATKPPERKKDTSKSSVVPSSHHRPSHSSASTGALDLQAVVARSGSSSISGMTVPIRLDALSYLLNSAVMGSSRMPAQMPCYPPMYPAYPQMGCTPYGTCMNSPYCATPFPNQYPACHQGFMPYGNQQVMQTCQYPAPNFNQNMGDMTQAQNNSLPSTAVNPQAGMTFNPMSMASNTPGMMPAPAGMPFTSAGTSLMQNSSGTVQSEANSWSSKPYERDNNNEKFGSNERFGNESFRSSFSSERGQQRSPRRGFGRGGDRRNDDGWSDRQQTNSFGRGFGRGRGDFGGSSWRGGNSRGQDNEWNFGDRSRNRDFGNQKKFNSSPERFQDRGGFSKRGRWSGGRGRGSEGRDSWQQETREKSTPMWSSIGKSPERSSVGQETKPVGDKDEDWEMDYPESSTTPKPVETSEKPDVQSSVTSSPLSVCGANDESSGTLKPTNKIVGVLTTDLEKEEGETDSDSQKGSTATTEPEAKIEERDSTTPPIVISSEQLQETDQVTKEPSGEELYSFILTVGGEENKGILVEINEEGH
ncbi:uncharacterized protein [Hyperolius riggenbachi]|uniref:uncharacterized protein n=1 Tax=Hyperolius riggenbachi TaxID=752182 RepID=UPI0035A34415